MLQKKLRKIKTKNGYVIKVYNKKDLIKEVYYSIIRYNKVNAWKCHSKMKCNLLVVSGKILIVLKKGKNFKKFILNKDSCLLTIPPKTWFGFKCISKQTGYILNLANMTHSKKEVLTKDINYFKFKWTLKQ